MDITKDYLYEPNLGSSIYQMINDIWAPFNIRYGDTLYALQRQLLKGKDAPTYFLSPYHHLEGYGYYPVIAHLVRDKASKNKSLQKVDIIRSDVIAYGYIHYDFGSEIKMLTSVAQRMLDDSYYVVIEYSGNAENPDPVIPYQWD